MPVLVEIAANGTLLYVCRAGTLTSSSATGCVHTAILADEVSGLCSNKRCGVFRELVLRTARHKLIAGRRDGACELNPGAEAKVDGEYEAADGPHAADPIGGVANAVLNLAKSMGFDEQLQHDAGEFLSSLIDSDIADGLRIISTHSVMSGECVVSTPEEKASALIFVPSREHVEYDSLTTALDALESRQGTHLTGYNHDGELVDNARLVSRVDPIGRSVIIQLVRVGYKHSLGVSETACAHCGISWEGLSEHCVCCGSAKTLTFAIEDGGFIREKFGHRLEYPLILDRWGKQRRLVFVGVHHGGPDSGHYDAYLRVRGDDGAFVWLQVDGVHIERVDEIQVLLFTGGDGLSTASILIYNDYLDAELPLKPNTGLRNCGNTCYLATAVAALYALGVQSNDIVDAARQHVMFLLQTMSIGSAEAATLDLDYGAASESSECGSDVGEQDDHEPLAPDPTDEATARRVLSIVGSELKLSDDCPHVAACKLHGSTKPKSPIVQPSQVLNADLTSVLTDDQITSLRAYVTSAKNHTLLVEVTREAKPNSRGRLREFSVVAIKYNWTAPLGRHLVTVDRNGYTACNCHAVDASSSNSRHRMCDAKALVAAALWLTEQCPTGRPYIPSPLALHVDNVRALYAQGKRLKAATFIENNRIRQRYQDWRRFASDLRHHCEPCEHTRLLDAPAVSLPLPSRCSAPCEHVWPTTFVPPAETHLCPHCDGGELHRKQFDKATLFIERGCMLVQVIVQTCTLCGYCVTPQPSDNGVFYFNERYLFAIPLLINIRNAFAKGLPPSQGAELESAKCGCDSRMLEKAYWRFEVQFLHTYEHLLDGMAGPDHLRFLEYPYYCVVCTIFPPAIQLDGNRKSCTPLTHLDVSAAAREPMELDVESTWQRYGLDVFLSTFGSLAGVRYAVNEVCPWMGGATRREEVFRTDFLKQTLPDDQLFEDPSAAQKSVSDLAWAEFCKALDDSVFARQALINAGGRKSRVNALTSAQLSDVISRLRGACFSKKFGSQAGMSGGTMDAVCDHKVEYAIGPSVLPESPKFAVKLAAMFKHLPNLNIFDFWCGVLAHLRTEMLRIGIILDSRCGGFIDAGKVASLPTIDQRTWLVRMPEAIGAVSGAGTATRICPEAAKLEVVATVLRTPHPITGSCGANFAHDRFHGNPQNSAHQSNECKARSLDVVAEFDAYPSSAVEQMNRTRQRNDWHLSQMSPWKNFFAHRLLGHLRNVTYCSELIDQMRAGLRFNSGATLAFNEFGAVIIVPNDTAAVTAPTERAPVKGAPANNQEAEPAISARNRKSSNANKNNSAHSAAAEAATAFVPDSTTAAVIAAPPKTAAGKGSRKATK